MSDKYAGGIKAGSTSVSILLPLLNAADGTEVTGKVASALTATYRREGGTQATISLSDLSAIDSAWSSGGVKEDAGGLYRLDLPNAALATGADYLRVLFSCTGSYVTRLVIPLETKGAAEVFTLAGTINTTVSALPSASAVAAAVWAAGTRSLTTFGTLVADVATAVWGAGTRSLTLVSNIVNAVLDEVLPGTHSVADSVAVKIAGAAAAADPLLNDPAAYASGTIGYDLAHLADNTTDIAFIKGKVTGITYTVAGRVDATATVDASTVATALLNAEVEAEGHITLKQAQSIALAVLGGVESFDATTGTITFRTPNGAAVRLVGIVDPTTQARTSSVLTPSA